MAFFKNNCPNGQFKCDILPGEYAVNRSNQARSEIQDNLGALAKMPVLSAVH
jgi:hypothetical protein